MNINPLLAAAFISAISALSVTAGNIPQYRISTDGAPYEPIDGIRINPYDSGSATIGICPGGILENNELVQGFPIGFDLIFGGVSFNQFVIESSGRLYFGKDKVNFRGPGTFTISMSPVSHGIKESEISYLTEGVPGERVLTVQFANVTMEEETSSKGRYNMQIRLFEADGHAEIAFEQLNIPYKCPGFDVSLHGWDEEDSLVITASDISAAPKVANVTEASMLDANTFVAWNRIDDGIQRTLNYRITPEQSDVPPTSAPQDLTVLQVESSAEISVRRAPDAGATLVLWSEQPITEADFPRNGETFPASSDFEETTTMFGNARALYYGPAEEINLSVPDMEDYHDYYIVALSANGYPAFNTSNPAQAHLRTTQPAPQFFHAESAGDTSLSLTCEADDKVIIAASTQTIRGFQKGYHGIYGTPDANMVAGDEIPGGGTVIYVGEPSQFNYECAPNELTYFRAWTVADGQVSAKWTDTFAIPDPTLPYAPKVELYPYGIELDGWISGAKFAPWYRDIATDDYAILCITPSYNTPVSLSTPELPLDVPVKVTFEFSLETYRGWGKGFEPGWFGSKGYLHVKTGDGTVHKVIRSYDGEMTEVAKGYADFTSTFISQTVIIPSCGGPERITWTVSTEVNSAFFLRNIAITPLDEEPYTPSEAPTMLRAEEDADGFINISCRRAEDATQTLVLFSDRPFTDADIPTYGYSVEVGQTVGNAKVLYIGNDEEIRCSTAYTYKGNPEFIFADYDSDCYIRAISCNDIPAYNYDNMADLIYHTASDPSGVTNIGADSTTGLEIYTVTGLRVDVANIRDLPAGLYIINGKKHIIR